MKAELAQLRQAHDDLSGLALLCAPLDDGLLAGKTAQVFVLRGPGHSPALPFADAVSTSSPVATTQIAVIALIVLVGAVSKARAEFFPLSGTIVLSPRGGESFRSVGLPCRPLSKTIVGG